MVMPAMSPGFSVREATVRKLLLFLALISASPASAQVRNDHGFHYAARLLPAYQHRSINAGVDVRGRHSCANRLGCDLH